MKNKILIKMGDFFTKYRFVFLVFFLSLTIFAFVHLNDVKVNDSIVSYLPDNTETKTGIDIMDDEFGDLSTIKIMTSDTTLDEAKNISSQLEKIKDVKMVLFDDSSYSYNDEKALYSIQVENLKGDRLDTIKNDIQSSVGDKDYVIYSEAFDDPTSGVNTILLIVCAIIMVVLLLTSKTYFEVVIAFIIFGISIVLNMGTNYLFGEISYITKAIAIILQLALSIDYVIIFMNQYMKEISDTTDTILAIKKTESKAMVEIFASSLTTIAGLLALVFMQLKIGGDIGIVLSKGIICSLVTVILVMPSLLFIFNKPIIKLQKKVKPNKLIYAVANNIFKCRKVLLGSFLVLAIGGIILTNNYHFIYNQESTKAINLSINTKAFNDIEDTFGTSNNLVILVKNSDKNYEIENKLTNNLLELTDVTNVSSIGGYKIAQEIHLGTKVNYLEVAKFLNIPDALSASLFKLYAGNSNETALLKDMNNYRVTIIDLIYFCHDNGANLPLPEEMGKSINNYYAMINNKINMLESENYSRFIINIDNEIESQETYDLIDNIRSTSENYYDEVILVGNSINAIDLEASFVSDNLIITGITILFIAIILLVTFKSIWMTALLILTIEGSILINFGILSLLGVNVFFMGYIVVSTIQMGATIDYAIVIASRYINLRKKKDKKEAIIETLNDCLPAVITSGFILLASGFIIGLITTSSIISQIGLFLGLGALISLIGTIFVLPSILYVTDKFIIKNRKR